MESVAFDLVENYPPVEPDDFANGEIKNLGYPNLCLAVNSLAKDEEVVVDDCKSAKSEQQFQLSWHKDVRPKKGTECLDVSKGEVKSPVTLYPCHGKQGNQLWRYDTEKQWLLHGYVQNCLDMDPDTRKVFVTSCDPVSVSQKWQIEHINEKAMKEWDKSAPKGYKKIDF